MFWLIVANIYDSGGIKDSFSHYIHRFSLSVNEDKSSNTFSTGRSKLLIINLSYRPLFLFEYLSRVGLVLIRKKIKKDEVVVRWVLDSWIRELYVYSIGPQKYISIVFFCNWSGKEKKIWFIMTWSVKQYIKKGFQN